MILDGSVLWAFPSSNQIVDARGVPGRSAGERCSAVEEVRMVPCSRDDREVGHLQDGSFTKPRSPPCKWRGPLTWLLMDAATVRRYWKCQQGLLIGLQNSLKVTGHEQDLFDHLLLVMAGLQARDESR